MLFDSVAEMDTFMATTMDRPIKPRTTTLTGGMRMVAKTRKTGLTTFTNIYDLQWSHQGSLRAVVNCHTPTQSITKTIANEASMAAIVNGGFFYLTDKDRDNPQHVALNFAVENNVLLSLPIIDREALIIMNNTMRARVIQAQGVLHIGDRKFRWRGSRTEHSADCTIFNLSNVHVHYVDDARFGTMRQLDSTTRYTPIITVGTPQMDLGIVEQDGKLVVAAQDWGGSLDLFKYNFVIRCPRASSSENMIGQTVIVDTVDDLKVADIQGALTTGPALDAPDFNNHNVNFDLSLCDKPPFIDCRTARLVLLSTQDTYHLVLFDSRKGSETFAGVTPTEVRDSIREMYGPIVWGCFLDSGLTSKIAVRHAGTIQTFGNRHYTRWPKSSDEKFHWIPDEGRLVGSSIALHMA